MKLRYHCPFCKKAIAADSKLSEKRVNCPGCQESHVVPGESESYSLSLREETDTAASITDHSEADRKIQVVCESCQRIFRTRSENQHNAIVCPKCGVRTSVHVATSSSRTGVGQTASQSTEKERGQPTPKTHGANSSKTIRKQRAETKQQPTGKSQTQAIVEQQEIARKIALVRAEEAGRKQRERIERLQREDEAEALRQIEQARKTGEKRQRREIEAERCRLAEEKARRRAEEQARLEAEEKAQRRAEEQARVDAEELRRQYEIQRIIAAREQALKIQSDISSDFRPVSEKLVELEFQRLDAFLDWRKSDNIADFERFEKIELQRWSIERIVIERNTSGVLSAHSAPPQRRRLGPDLAEFLATPCPFSISGVPWPIAAVAANPLQLDGRGSSASLSKLPTHSAPKVRKLIDSEAINVGLEFLLNEKQLDQLIAVKETPSEHYETVSRLFWFDLSEQQDVLLRGESDIAVASLGTVFAYLLSSTDGTLNQTEDNMVHALSLYWLNVAILKEAAFASGWIDSGVGYWDIALEYWARVYADDAFWIRFCNRPGQTEDSAIAARDDLPWFLSALICQFAMRWEFQGDNLSAERLIAVLRRSSLPEVSKDLGSVATVRGCFS